MLMLSLDIVFQIVFKLVNFLLAWAVLAYNLKFYRPVLKQERLYNERVIHTMFIIGSTFASIYATMVLYRLFTHGPTMIGSPLDDASRITNTFILTTMLIETMGRRKWAIRS